MATKLEDLRLLQDAERICDAVWDVVNTWNAFAKDTIGQQLVRAADSVGANIAESYGRFHYGEKIQFLYYSRGSLYETKYWLSRASKRQLLSGDDVQTYAEQLDKLARSINAFISSIRQQRKT